jgi:hypothetical protein
MYIQHCPIVLVFRISVSLFEISCSFFYAA